MKNSHCHFCILLLLFVSSPLWATQVTSPNNLWTALTMLPVSQGGNSGQIFDPFNDQQTGDDAADFVGTLAVPGLYMGFDGLGDSNPLTGNLMFRARLGTIHAGDFSSAFLIGIDANLDGVIDIFIGADQRQTNGKAIKVWAADCGNKTPCNTTPSTTGLGAQQGADIAETTANYYYTFVTSALDPGNLNFDLDGDGANDAFLSFAVDIGLIRTYLNTLNLQYPGGGGAVPPFSENSTMRIIAVTSQQSNSFNQDLGGCATVNSATTWVACGLTDTFRPKDLPEPGTVFLAGAGLISLWYIRRRKITRA